MIRAFHRSGSTLVDFTKKVEKYKSDSYALTYSAVGLSPDYLFIGRPLPFNHFYIKMGATTNLIPASMSLSYWDGRAWVPAVELIDETDALKQSGFVTFVPNRDTSWSRESTKASGESITGLELVTIYDLYWVRIAFNATLTPALGLNWIGQLFSNDLDLYSEHPRLNNTHLLNCFETGKTNWEEQHVKAAEKVEQELRKQGVILGGEQIMVREDYTLAATSKTAEIIYSALGDDYVDDAGKSKDEFKERLDLSVHAIDHDGDGRLTVTERFDRVGFLTR